MPVSVRIRRSPVRAIVKRIVARGGTRGRGDKRAGVGEDKSVETSVDNGRSGMVIVQLGPAVYSRRRIIG